MKLKLKYYLRGLGLGIVVTATILSILSSKEDKMTDEEIIARAEELGMIEDTVLLQDMDKDNIDGQEADNVPPDTTGNAPGGLSDAEGADSLAPDEEPEPDGELKTGALLPESWRNIVPDASDMQSGTDGADAQDRTDTQNGADTQTGTDAVGDENPIDADSETDKSGMTSADNEGTAPGAAFPKVIIISSGEGSYTVSKKLAEIGAVESAEDFDTYLCEHGYDKKIRAGTYTIPVDATDEQMAKIVTGAKPE